MPQVRALVFDVFGTVVDWRGSIIEQGKEFSRSRHVDVDWARFADRWRAGYGPAMDLVRTGKLPWQTIDQLHRRVLDQLLVEFGITGLAEPDKIFLNRVWHRLRSWPDSVEGLARLKKKYIIGPLSNGNVSLLTNMAKFAGLPWDVILSAELAHHYKPDPESYLTAARLLDLDPSQVMMVAAHVGDLRAAAKVGMRTGFVTRPLEYGPSGKADLKMDPPADVQAADFIGLARQMS
ncbi:MAG: haloacid dehalogenase type II [Bryobacteraceae bacterium]